MANVNRAERAVISAGGRVLAERRKFPRRGEQALFADPEGALFGVIRVRNIGETVALTTQSGGRVLLQPNADIKDGKVAVIADPTGAALGLLEWDGTPTEGKEKPWTHDSAKQSSWQPSVS